MADRRLHAARRHRHSRLQGARPRWWSGLPPALRDHLFDRLRERKITAEDLYQLKAWRESNPDAPEGLWYKDFGSFKICGDGKYPRTFLLAGQAAKGQKL